MELGGSSAQVVLATLAPFHMYLMVVAVSAFGVISVIWAIIVSNRHRREDIRMELSASGEWRDLPRSSRRRPRMGLAIGLLASAGLLATGAELMDGLGSLEALFWFLVVATMLVHVYKLSLAHASPLELSGRRTGLPFDTVERTVEGVLRERGEGFHHHRSGRYRQGRVPRELRRTQGLLEVGDPDGCFLILDGRFLQVRDLGSEREARVHVKLFYDGERDGRWVHDMKASIDAGLDGTRLEGS